MTSVRKREERKGGQEGREKVRELLKVLVILIRGENSLNNFI